MPKEREEKARVISGASVDATHGTGTSRPSFIRVLNQRLPKKRCIAQGLVRNERGEVLMCELTYKSDWDLPGGVVDPGESPASCVEREIKEELALDLRAGSLMSVNWLPPYRGWDDAILFLFDLGTVDSGVLDQTSLLAREIAGVHWVGAGEVAAHVAPYTAELIRRVLAAADQPSSVSYLENSAERPH